MGSCSRPCHGLIALVLAAAAGLPAALRSQTTVLPVNTNSEAAVDAAIRAANALAFLTSPSSPVVIEFGSHLIGQSIALTQALPVLVVDHVTVRVAGAQPASRVTLHATTAATVFRIASHHAVVQNVRFLNSNLGNQDDVFTAFGTDDLTVSHCDFDFTQGSALWLIGCTATTVQDCTISRSGNGLAVTGGTADLAVLRCNFPDNQLGALISSSHRVQIRDCTFDRNVTAMFAGPVSTDVTFGPNNTVRNSTGLGAVVAGGTWRLNILASQFTDNRRLAIQLSELCVTSSVTGCTLARNGLAVGDYQMSIDDCLDVQVSSLQCTAGGAGLFAGDSRQVRITGSAAAPSLIAGNQRDGLMLEGCSDLAIDQVTVTGNLTAASGAQVTLFDCDRAWLGNSTISSAPGAGRIGLRVDQSRTVRVGLDTSVLDHGAQGVLVGGCDDVTLGNWSPGSGSLYVRGPSPLQIDDCDRVLVRGTAAAPCSLQAGPSGSNFGLSITNSRTGTCGPHIAIDGRQSVAQALQLAGSSGWTIDGVTMTGHTGWGIVANNAAVLQVRNCQVDGGAQQAANEGMLLNGNCHAAQLLGNLVTRHNGTAFAILDSNDVWLGPGNRAIDNAGDGFLLQDTGSGPVSRRGTIQSAVAVGRGLTGQNGFRCVRMRAALTNVTATRNGTGVLLQLGANVTLVNAISWGNGVDRNRDAASTGNWRRGLRATTAGGTWSDQDMITGQDPQFVAAATGDVRLRAGSPAINSGLHATPVGSGLPCTDADLSPRIRGGTIDRGAYEFVPAAGTGNSLDLAGPWLRTVAQGQLDFTVQRGAAQAGQMFLLMVSGSGTGPGFTAPGGAQAPLVPDFSTGLLQSAPAWCLGMLNGTGNGAVSLPLPPSVIPFLPELSFTAVVNANPQSTNPVVVRFLQ